MNDRQVASLARMASQELHEALIERASKDRYLVPEELLDEALSTMRSLVLDSEDPLKDRLLDLYVYCVREGKRTNDRAVYGSREWINIRTAVKNFLINLAKVDLAAWEQKELNDA